MHMEYTDRDIILILESLIESYGKNWCDKRKIYGYLIDYMIDDPRQRVLAEVMTSSEAYNVLVKFQTARIPFWIKYCDKHLFLENSFACWAVYCWCKACKICDNEILMYSEFDTTKVKFNSTTSKRFDRITNTIKQLKKDRYNG